MGIRRNNPCLVSVIIPAYNHDKYIRECILSIVNQTYPHLELIVINDGSTDSTLECLQNLVPICQERFSRFELINKENEGVAHTLNLALRYAGGKYVYIFASDDVSCPDAISTLVEVAEIKNGIAVVCADAELIDEEGKISNLAANNNTFLTYYTCTRSNFDANRDFGSYRSLLLGNYIPIGSLIRRSVFDDVGFYTEGIRIEDFDLWLRVAKKHKFKFVNYILASYRVHSENTVTREKKSLIIDTLKIYKREQAYCFQQGLSGEWNDAYLTNLVSLLKHGGLLSFIEFVKGVKLYSLFVFVISKFFSKLSSHAKIF